MIAAMLLLFAVNTRAAEVASAATTFLGQLGETPVPLADTGRGSVNRLPVTYVGGLVGTTPRGTCDLEAERNRDGSVSLFLAALKSPMQSRGFFAHEIVIPATAYPLRAGWHFVPTDGGDAMEYDGFTLRVRTGSHGGSAATYQISVDPYLRHVTRVDAALYDGPPQATPAAALGCDPALG